jgi:hypothetical protein
MTGILNALIAGVSGAVKDTYFNLVSLLLPGNGTNGKKNNDFVDSSTANSGTGWPITPNGDVTQGTFSPFSQTGWGNYFNGSNTYLQVTTTNAAFALGTGNYTLEGFFFFTSTPQTASNPSFLSSQNGGFIGWRPTTTGMEVYIPGVGSPVASDAFTIPVNQWVHLATVRTSNSLAFFMNGQQQGATKTDNNNYAAPTAEVIINRTGTGGPVVSGYTSNLRIVKGVAVYTGNFTVPVSPLTATQSAGTNIAAITGTQTSLLTCQSNRCIDNGTANSGAGFTITPVNSPSVQAFSPFAPTSSYSAAAVGGSGYFDGASDYLTVPDNAAWDVGSSNFTIEGWFYPTGSPAQPILIGQWTSSYSWVMLLSNDSNRYIRGILYNGSAFSDYVSTAPLQLNAWNHCAFVRESNTVSLYLNGSRVLTNTFTGSVATSTSAVSLGANSSGADPYLGYMSSTRVVVGTALYSGTTYTVPTAPLTAVSGTQLLLNFTNAGVVDATAKNVLETEGNAQISTSVKQFGTGSIAFSSSNSSLRFPQPASNWTFLHDGSSWTIEFWLYPVDIVNFQGLISTNGAASASIGVSVVINSSTIGVSFTRGVPGSSAGFSSSATLTANSWNYVGITFNGSTKTCSFFINGASAGSSSNTGFSYSSSAPTYPLFIAQTGDPTYPYNFNGYLDDIRITRGVVRTISANPTAPFPLQ